MKSVHPWVRFFPGNWLAQTRGMTASETGVLITLTCLMYEHQEPLPREDAKQARQCVLPTAVYRRALTELIAANMITEQGGCLWNLDVENELANRKIVTAKARASATAKWEKAKQDQDRGDAVALRSHSGRNARNDAIYNNKEETSLPPTSTGDRTIAMSADNPLIAVIGELRGKPVIIGKTFHGYVSADEIEQARAKMAGAA